MLILFLITSESIQTQLHYVHASNLKNNLLWFEALFISKKRNDLTLRQVYLFLKKKKLF